MTALDFGTVTIEDVAPNEVPSHGRTTSNGGPSPLLKHVQQTYENGGAKSVTVPSHAVKDVVQAVRSAANELEIGSQIWYQTPKGQALRFDYVYPEGLPSDPDDKKKKILGVFRPDDRTKVYTGNVKVTFRGKQKRTRKNSDEAQETAV